MGKQDKLPTRGWKRRNKGSRGAMMILVIVSLTVLGGVMAASLEVFKTTDKVIEYELNYHGQAVNTAKAGLIDALSWFRRQTAQPVDNFTPTREFAVIPPLNETDDQIIGLVREYEISTVDNLWERYEVRLGRQRLDDDGHLVVEGVKDITEQRGLTGSGRFWYIEAKGYLFHRLDPNYTPDQFYSVYETEDGKQRTKQLDGSYLVVNTPRNGVLEEQHDATVVKVLATARMGTELRRLTVIPPAQAAICAVRGDDVALGNRCRVLGGANFGLTYLRNTGSHYKHSSAELNSFVTIDPTLVDYNTQMEDVFGVSREQLRTLSDLYVDDPANLPDELPEYSLVYIDCDVVFDATLPLRGTAIVYVDGDVTLAANSSSYFSGILFVEGNFVQNAPSLVNGTIIGKNNVSISGLGDYSEVNFDPTVRQRILTISGQYRFSSPMYFLD